MHIFKLRSIFASAIALMIGLGAASAEDIVVFNDARNDAYVKLGQPGGVGDRILWHSDMQTADGTPIGTGSGTCTRLDAPGNHFCTFVIDLTGRGILSGSGVQRVEPLQSTFPITGGSGDFSGSRGIILSKPVEDRKRFWYAIRLEPTN